jgi:hypothetical protein
MSIKDKIHQVSQNDCAGRLLSRLNGPGEFFANNAFAYALSLSGAGTAVGLFATRAATARGLKRLGWALLSALEAVIFIGIIVVTEEAKRAASSD